MKGSGIQMKKNLEEMQVKVANKRAILESHDGEEFSPITVAKNVLCEDGTTMQDYFDNHSEPNISTKIVNSNSMSKVGQGDSVDFSDNVMNGAYEDVVLKGRSLVNVIQGSSKDKVVLPYSFEEGEMVTINDTHPNGRVEVEVRGRTLANLASPHEEREVRFTYRWQTYNVINDKIVGGLVDGELIYMSMEINIHEINIETPIFRIMSQRDFGGYAIVVKSFDELKAMPKNEWIKVSTIGTVNAEYSLDRYSLQCGIMGEHPTEGGEQVARVSFRKPMWINLTKMFGKGKEPTLSECDNIPYFEGMTSVQAPTVKTCGKNLLDPNSVELIVKSNNSAQTITYDTKTDTYEFLCPNSYNQMNITIKNKYDIVNTNRMFISGTYESDGGVHEISQRCSLENGEIGLTIRHDWKPVTKANVKIMFTKEEITSSTTYERYQSSSLTLPEEVVLQGLSNGVCDTYNTKTKEYVRRIGEIVLDGSDDEQWGYSEGGSEQGKKCFNLPSELTPHRKRYGYTICDHMPITTTLDKVGVYNGQSLNILIDSNSNDVGVLKEILASKPITVQYELATPIVTKINLLSLKAYNTITHLSSTVGEGSLVPTLASDNTISYPAILKPNTKYSIIAHKDRNNHSNHLNYTFDLGGATTTCSVNDTITTVTTPSTLSHQELRVKGQELAISSVRVIEGEVTQDLPYFEGICDVKSPVIHNVDTIEETDSRKINTTTFTSNDDEIIVLRSLPNGVCDTLNVKTGEYVQIIGEITLDGTKRDDLVYHAVLKDNDGDFIRMIINGCSFYDNNKYGNCDKLPFYHEEKIKDSVEAVFPFAGEKHFYIKIKTSRINGAETMENNSSQLRDTFLNWLAQNPITVQYELATPIVKQVNVEGYPYAYENGHILLESGSQEQSLTPTIEYSIVANRGGQIRSNQRMVERHQKKLDSLYAMTLVNMIDSQYKQVLMKLKSDLGSEVTSWDI